MTTAVGRCQACFLHARYGNHRRFARHGLGIAVGMAMGLKRKANRAFVYNLMSDGRAGEGSTWEAAMSGAHHKLDNLICLVDFNDQQADGKSTEMLCSSR